MCRFLNIFFLFNFFVLHRSLKNLLLPSLFNLKEVKRIHEFSKVYTILFIVQHRTKNFPILSSFSHLFFVISSHKESVSSVKTTNSKKKKKRKIKFFEFFILILIPNSENIKLLLLLLSSRHYFNTLTENF